MAKPRIFISSTFFDLRQIRSDLDSFIENMGYEPVRNEEGDIPFGSEDGLEDYCYKEIKNVDILISIIGGRFGSESRHGGTSISQVELRTAIKEGKQVYIFIEKNVSGEYETYLLNKSTDIKYKYVDDKRIYSFIEEIKGLGANNNIKTFESASDITKYLKEQFAGLFQRFLEEQTREKEIVLIKGLERTAETLNKLVNYLSEENKGHPDEINRILQINHPLIDELKRILQINYNIYIEGLTDLTNLLLARGYKFEEYPTYDELDEDYDFYKTLQNKKTFAISIKKSLFDFEGKLKHIKRSDWDKSNIVKRDITSKSADDDIQF